MADNGAGWIIELLSAIAMLDIRIFSKLVSTVVCVCMHFCIKKYDMFFNKTQTRYFCLYSKGTV